MGLPLALQRVVAKSGGDPQSLAGGASGRQLIDELAEPGRAPKAQEVSHRGEALGVGRGGLGLGEPREGGLEVFDLPKAPALGESCESGVTASRVPALDLSTGDGRRSFL